MSKTIKQIDKEIERLENLKDNLLSKTIIKCKNCGKGTQVNKLIFHQVELFELFRQEPVQYSIGKFHHLDLGKRSM